MSQSIKTYVQSLSSDVRWALAQESLPCQKTHRQRRFDGWFNGLMCGNVLMVSILFGMLLFFGTRAPSLSFVEYLSYTSVLGMICWGIEVAIRDVRWARQVQHWEKRHGIPFQVWEEQHEDYPVSNAEFKQATQWMKEGVERGDVGVLDILKAYQGQDYLSQGLLKKLQERAQVWTTEKETQGVEVLEADWKALSGLSGSKDVGVELGLVQKELLVKLGSEHHNDVNRSVV